MILAVFVQCISLLITCKISGVDSDISNENSNDGAFNFNVTHVLIQSIMFCGPEIVCNKTLLTLFNVPNLLFNETTRCEPCACSEDCVSAFPPENCCPDLYFRNGLRECLDLNILSKGPDLTNTISSCPVGVNDEMSLECTRNRSKVELLHNPPVYSAITFFVYKNRYCALCNGASALVDWNAKVLCENETDFNYLSTFQEIIDLAIAEECSIRYFSSGSSLGCFKTYKQQISTCNVSETWRKYDKQIDKACESSYAGSMGIFKNIFCAMCNPPKLDDSMIIEDCKNVTSVYKEACLTFPILESSGPYKNFFCFLCNKEDNNSLFYNDVYFHWANEVLMDLEESPKLNGSLFRLTVYFGYIDEQVNRYANDFLKSSDVTNTKLAVLSRDISSLVNDNEPFCPSEYDSVIRTPLWLEPKSPRPQVLPSNLNIMRQYNYITRVSYSSINISSLILKSFAFTKHGACATELLPSYTKSLQLPCSCSIGCTTDCCDDFAFKQPWACIDDRYERNGEEKDFMAISGCLRDRTIETLCMKNYTSHFYFAIPVTSTEGNFESYVNIFCYLCNTDTENGDYNRIVFNATLTVEPWSLVLECKTYINYRSFLSLKQLIDYANRGSCIASFLPPSKAEKCSRGCDGLTSTAIKKCNVSGTWESFDEDVLLACEHAEIFRFPMIAFKDNIYKNKFCRICNPFDPVPLQIDCNNFAENADIALACEELPSVKTCFPYKNAFCELCNCATSCKDCYILIEPSQPGPTGIVGPINPPEPPPIITFRSMFSLAAYDTPSKPSSGLTCSQYQTIDNVEQLCRNLTCFPGKLLDNDTCKFLLPMASKLRYTLGLKITLPEINSKNVRIQQALNTGKEYISNKLISVIDTDIFIEDLILMANEACNQSFNKLRDIYVYIKIYIPQNVQRRELEEILLNLNETFSDLILFYDFVHSLKTSVNIVNVSIVRDAIFLPSVVEQLDREGRERVCFVSSNFSSYGSEKIRNVIVSSLLRCKQVIVQSNEFGVDWSSFQTNFPFSGVNISYYLFESTETGGFRICIQDLTNFLYMQQRITVKSDISTLEILTIVCLSVSLISLVITFITYSLFASLRTIPGLNNMCLVASLFVAQMMMVIMPVSRSIGRGNSIILSLFHYSWLATFFWFQVCSFHMFRVFTSKSRSSFHGTQVGRILLKYALYAFGLPLLIVLANFTITMIATDGRNSGYDNMSTLLTYKVAFIVTLILPLIFVCATNLMFYILTAYKIYSTPQVENKTGNRMHFSVYVKLFSLTGLSWLLQIIDIFLAVSFLSYIVTILNGLQGLFIFVSYVCNRRVWKLCTERFRHKKPLQSQTSSSSGSKTGVTSA